MSSPLRAEFAAAAARAQPEARVPALLTRSASGLDPHLPLDAALAQVDRVAGQRGLDPVRLTEQVKSAAQAGILGPQVVNILQLNLQLDHQRAPEGALAVREGSLSTTGTSMSNEVTAAVRPMQQEHGDA